jgi:hypothetical protein
MLTKNKMPLVVAAIICLEIVIYLWALWTSTMDQNNFFAIEPVFIFDKCARNSGRVSSALNLSILIMIGYYGFNQIHNSAAKWDKIRILITLFAINHLAHFFFSFKRLNIIHWLSIYPKTNMDSPRLSAF